jgi:hypothetical protein
MMSDFLIGWALVAFPIMLAVVIINIICHVKYGKEPRDF